MTPEPSTDELLRGYLLGELPEPEAESLEQRLLADDDLFDLLETLESEMLTAASRGELSPPERDRVLGRLASTPRGRERLAFARALDAVANRDAESAPAPLVPLLRRRDSRRSSNRPLWMVLAAALLLVLVGLFWMRTRTPHQGDTRPQIAQLDETPTPANPAGPRQPAPGPVAPPPAATPAPTPSVNQRPESHPAPPKMPPLVRAVLQLALTTTRGTGNQEVFNLPAQAEIAEIQIDLEGLEDVESFRATVRSSEGGVVWEGRDLKGQSLSWGRALVLEIPAERLLAGSYEITVNAISGGVSEPEMIQQIEVVRTKG